MAAGAGDRMSPAETLVEQLADARKRGEPFEQVWPDALSRALEVAGGRERKEWRSVLGSMVPTWQAAYLRVPADEPAMAMVADTRSSGAK